jgi:SAM-dependent methyltransferase
MPESLGTWEDLVLPHLSRNPDTSVEAQEARDAYLLAEHARLGSTASVNGLVLTLVEGTFHPEVGMTSKLMGVAVRKFAQEGSYTRFVDVGTGSGNIAFQAAQAGARIVIAVDNHGPALKSACRNLEANRSQLSGSNVHIIESDILAAAGVQDLLAEGPAVIACNHSFYPGVEGLGLEDGGEVFLSRLFEQVDPLLKTGSVLILSSCTGLVPFQIDPGHLATERGYDVQVLELHDDNGYGTSYSYVCAVTAGTCNG